MSPIEYLAAGLGLINITLIMLRNVWNYAFGIPMVLLYGFVFFDAKLYSDAILQVYFLVMQLYGLWHWLQGREHDGAAFMEGDAHLVAHFDACQVHQRGVKNQTLRIANLRDRLCHGVKLCLT